MVFSLCPVKPGPSTGQMGEGRRHSALGPLLGQQPCPSPPPADTHPVGCMPTPTLRPSAQQAGHPPTHSGLVPKALQAIHSSGTPTPPRPPVPSSVHFCSRGWNLSHAPSLPYASPAPSCRQACRAVSQPEGAGLTGQTSGGLISVEELTGAGAFPGNPSLGEIFNSVSKLPLSQRGAEEAQIMLGHLHGGSPPPLTASSPLAALVEGPCVAMATWPNLLTTTPGRKSSSLQCLLTLS